MKTARFIIVGVIVLAIGGYWLWTQYENRHPGPIRLSGTVEADDIGLGSRIGGRVVEASAVEGQSVTAGQVLARLDRAPLETQRAQVQAQLAQQRAALAELVNGSRPEDIAQAQAQVAQSRAALDLLLAGTRAEQIQQARADWEARRADLAVARATLERMQRMRTQGVISPQEFDTAQAQADSAAGLAEAARQQYEQALTGPRPEDIAQARAALAAAEASRDRVVAGPRSEEIDAARARVAQSEATLAQMDVDLAEMDIVASRDAHLEIFDLRPGDLVAPNQTVATLVLPNSLWVRVYIPEDRLGWVHVGQPLDVRVDTWPGEVFHGFIDQINRRAEFTPRNVQTVEERIKQVFGVRVRLDNSSDKLRPGMAADVTIPAPAAGANSSSRIPVASPNSSSRNSVAGEATP